MSTTRRISLAAVLLVVCAIWPAESEACTSGAVANATTDEVRALVRRINGRGFDQLLVRGNQDGNRDIIATPFPTWYLDQFLSNDWRERRDVVAATLLDEITKSVSFSASVGANRNTSSFTQKDADVARRALCASISQTPEGDYDLSVVLSMRGDMTFTAGSLSGLVHLPFFSDGVVSGIRLESDNGNTLLLFWTTSSDIDRLRSILNNSRWDVVTGEFHNADVFVDGIAFERTLTAVLRPDSLSGFDTAVAPGLSPWDALPANVALSVAPSKAQFRIDEALYGYSTKPKRVTSNGETFTTGSLHSAQADFSTPVPPSQRFSSLSPMVYVVVNRATGCILLVGIHT
jgi:hypothetical protein